MNVRALANQFLATSAAHLRRHPIRVILILISIAIGVALFVSLRVTQASLLATFQANLDALAGGAQYAITSERPLTPEILSGVEKIPGVRASPLIEAASVLTDQRESVHVFGIDLARDARLRNYRAENAAEVDLATVLLTRDIVVVPRMLAERHGWSLRSPITLSSVRGPQTFTIGGILKADGPARAFGGNIVFMPLATAQRFLNRSDTFSRIELALDPPATVEQVS